MVTHTPPSARAGRPQAVSTAAIHAAAARIADDSGLEAVSFRALGDALGVSAMSIHRATGGIDALRHALIAELVEDAIGDTEWPEGDWLAFVTTFAYGLHDLLMRHPLVLEAHRKAALDTPGANDVAHRVVDALRTAGLSPEEAAYGYAAVHDFVTGHVAIRLGRGELELLMIDPKQREVSVFAEHHDSDRRFAAGLRMVLDGILAAADRNTRAGQ
ncbi:TetR/AcrR family transcriptional regulator C-terminal domain-containing protein [Leucobacter komagatae]|uniref:TetR family transcriptional regulator n=1 Tax=Leucobacter komagatae TaxID=55969 RepID=A0A0D0IU92_9MICO|nr:TetR/AcrR family transcriptional regulator C-terminal domain-containing protein [Leucobacter komagatae]KIP53093.1 TetR family transcriptional regulator [Leucobacter komagatae]